MRRTASSTTGQDLLAPLRERPERTALFFDIDGTLAPIVADPEAARVPAATQELLVELHKRYALVGCVSGRQAADARRVVGLGSLDYIGNHGLERLRPGAQDPEKTASIDSHRESVRTFAAGAYDSDLRAAGVRLEDKDSIWSFHWREADDEAAASDALRGVAEAAREEGLAIHWGRKVLEIRPPVAFDKGAALAKVLAEANYEGVLYGGDDSTDLDVFRKLRELQAAGRLERSVCVGVTSDEGPAEISTEADLAVAGTDGFRQVLTALLP